MSSPFHKRIALIAVIGVLLLVLGSAAALGLHHYQASSQQVREPVLGPIELPSTHGDFSLAQLDNNQVAVVTFGFTYCPDVCPMNQAVKKQALSELTEAQRERIVPLMISVDPERDTLERLEEYTRFFGDSFIGATGTQQQLEELTQRYGVFWRRVESETSAMGYTVDHSSSIYLVNREGQLLERVLYSSSPEALVDALNNHLGS